MSAVTLPLSAAARSSSTGNCSPISVTLRAVDDHAVRSPDLERHDLLAERRVVDQPSRRPCRRRSATSPSAMRREVRLDEALHVERGDRRGAVDDAALELAADPQADGHAADDEDDQAGEQEPARERLVACQAERSPDASNEPQARCATGACASTCGRAGESSARAIGRKTRPSTGPLLRPNGSSIVRPRSGAFRDRGPWRLALPAPSL